MSKASPVGQFLGCIKTHRDFVLQSLISCMEKMLLADRSRVSIMLRLCLNFEDFYPRYAYKRYAYKKISVTSHNYLDLQ